MPLEPAILLGVITLPVFAPLIALLQLLFPGLLGDHWKRYRVVIGVLLTQSSVLMVHWAVVRWWVTDRTWWTSEDALTAALLLVTLIGMSLAAWTAWRASAAAGADEPAPPPARVEFLALGGFALFGAAWAGYQYWATGSAIDPMAWITLACAVGWGHLWWRHARASAAPRRGPATTELIVLLVMAAAGGAWGLVEPPTAAGFSAGQVAGDWPTYRGNAARTGALADDAAPVPTPRVLWTFQPPGRPGRTKIHSSPTVVDGLVFVGALRQVLTFSEGSLYCINAVDGRELGGAPARAGDLVWQFTAGGTAKPIFSSPSVAAGRVYFGEGYHQDRRCRLFCVDAGHGADPLWSLTTGSHVESSPTVVGARIYVGAGDDGVLCLDASQLESSPDGLPAPRTVWRAAAMHVDASPLAAGDRVYVGTCVGDIHQQLEAVALDARSGDVVWRVPTSVPVAGSPALDGDGVLFGLGNGKFDHDAERPAGGVWRLDARTGDAHWKFDIAGSVLNSPAVAGGRVYFSARNGVCYCLDSRTGEPLWQRSLDAPLAAAPVVAADHVYVVSIAGVVSCLRAADGELVWRFDELRTAELDAYASPTLAGGRLYVAIGGAVHCLGEDAPLVPAQHLSVR